MAGGKKNRIRRERETVEAMIDIYCRGIHGSLGDLCPECQALRDYAGRRLERCPFQRGKTTCANCRVHCYKPDMREKIRQVMRYSGPRMTYRHPLLALLHFVDGFRKEADGRS
ncbi:MAG: nitrous oxide-stimulated promoter family protein [Nitrospirota bacterium]